MKINSNTIKLEKEAYEKLETVIKKIALENKIEKVSEVQIKLSKETGVVKFATDDYDFRENDIIRANVPMGMFGVVKEVHEDGSISVDIYLNEKGAYAHDPELLEKSDILLSPEDIKENNIVVVY